MQQINEHSQIQESQDSKKTGVFSVLLANIPDQFTQQDLQLFLQQANIVAKNVETLEIQTCQFEANQNVTNKFSVLTFESEERANVAVAALSAIDHTVQIDRRQVSMFAFLLQDGIEQFVQRNELKLIVSGIPTDLYSNDLCELFGDFGHVLIGFVARIENSDDESNFAFLMFEKEEEAINAIIEASGKYLGSNEIHLLKYSDALSSANKESNFSLLRMLHVAVCCEAEIYQVLNSDQLNNKDILNQIFRIDSISQDLHLWNKNLSTNQQMTAKDEYQNREADKIIEKMKKSKNITFVQDQFVLQLLSQIQDVQNEQTKQSQISTKVLIFNISPEICEQDLSTFLNLTKIHQNTSVSIDECLFQSNLVMENRYSTLIFQSCDLAQLVVDFINAVKMQIYGSTFQMRASILPSNNCYDYYHAQFFVLGISYEITAYDLKTLHHEYGVVLCSNVINVSNCSNVGYIQFEKDLTFEVIQQMQLKNHFQYIHCQSLLQQVEQQEKCDQQGDERNKVLLPVQFNLCYQLILESIFQNEFESNSLSQYQLIFERQEHSRIIQQEYSQQQYSNIVDSLIKVIIFNIPEQYQTGDLIIILEDAQVPMINIDATQIQEFLETTSTMQQQYTNNRYAITYFSYTELAEKAITIINQISLPNTMQNNHFIAKLFNDDYKLLLQGAPQSQQLDKQANIQQNYDFVCDNIIFISNISNKEYHQFARAHYYNFIKQTNKYKNYILNIINDSNLTIQDKSQKYCCCIVFKNLKSCENAIEYINNEQRNKNSGIFRYNQVVSNLFQMPIDIIMLLYLLLCYQVENTIIERMYTDQTIQLLKSVESIIEKESKIDLQLGNFAVDDVSLIYNIKACEQFYQKRIFVQAAINGKVQLIRMMKQIILPKQFESDEENPLKAALKGNSEEVVLELLGYQSRQKIGETELMLSCQRFSNLASKFLGQVRIQTSSGTTALIKAVQSKNLYAVQLLVQYEGKMTDDQNRTALYHVVQEQFEDAIPILIFETCVGRPCFYLALSKSLSHQSLHLLFSAEKRKIFSAPTRLVNFANREVLLPFLTATDNVIGGNLAHKLLAVADVQQEFYPLKDYFLKSCDHKVNFRIRRNGLKSDIFGRLPQSYYEMWSKAKWYNGKKAVIIFTSEFNVFITEQVMVQVMAQFPQCKITALESGDIRILCDEVDEYIVRRNVSFTVGQKPIMVK